MAYKTFTADDIRAALTASELTAAGTDQADGQTDPLTNRISWVTSEVRSKVASAWSLTEATGVPPGVIEATLAIIVYRYLARLPMAVSAERKQAYQDALEFLEKVAAGDINPDPAPDDGTSAAPGLPSINDTDSSILDRNVRQHTRADMEGM